MIRNRIPRFRNLQNLHVIPTASNFSSIPIPAQSESPNITIIPHPSITTIDIANTDFGQKMFGQNEPKGKFNKPRRNRNRRKRQPKCFSLTQAEIQNSSYEWYDSSYLNQPMYSDPPPEKIEEIDESIPEIPIEEDFEEVEVASVDGDGKQEILVGFRTSKLQYLNYKKKCFFKPKFYKFGSQRTLVNCLNVQDNSSVDIDIVSEAEYEIDETDNLDQSDSQDQQISKINEESMKSNEHNGSIREEKPIERSKVVEINDVNESSHRIFKTCIEENADINQAQCLIQSSLDTWKSHLIGFKMMNAFVENVKRTIKLPTPSKGKKSKKKVVAEPEISEPGVVYVVHIPRGFCKTEIKDYFSQFGEIRRLRLGRTSRTGGAKGFAYIEFESKEVAKIVAKTMNNYLLFEKPLKCEYIPSNEVHPNDFKGWNKCWPLKSEKNRQQQNAPKNEVQIN